ncbi:MULTISPECIES: 2-oxo acid dehydrogenase subunit E2 [Acinetobacter]|uniref:2-oxo acid dehydrogenase subunit E2 n=1 Tax=Acinetobacter TaxID=469 RepID=UPI0002CDEA39|nr:MULTISPECIES: 2-oxo acid dehydrogenase subunit E2 [Acinetobacter]ENV02823.1 pyruvate dehydrogenase complex dihydrolipoamide acetyltransferase [Acinetobacter sp. NIPH 817]MCU4635439.1 2-oxo acid dehydrogenase subunit E2 [Acinetobacter sp. WU_MDCI_Abxa265]NUF34291.1 2-oxo acid dehydrogenase subunit E2 [Acinetobacter oleivorans]RFF24989.1 diaminohydroxyphosphoribosylaminopyrimidine deaminase [Acinetobacter sp. JW]
MSEIKTLEIPKWGLSMEEGTIAQWLIKEGDSFNKGDEICEIETTKIVNVLEAPFAGTLRKILAKDGETLPVGGLIAVCAESEVSDAEIETFIASLGGSAAKAPEASSEQSKAETSVPVAEKAEQPQSIAASAPVPVKAAKGDYAVPESLQGYQTSDELFTTPHALKLAEKHNVNLAKVTGSGREGRISVQDIQKAVQAAGGQWPDIKQQTQAKVVKSTADDSRVSATPVARRLAKQWGINLNDCRVSGTRGRVCKEDVEAVYYRNNPTSVNEQSAQCAVAQPQSTVTTVAMNGMRKAIASRLQAAKRNAPHFRLVVDLNVEAMQKLRKQINETVPQVKLSINDMLIKAAAAALIKVPEVNVQFDEATQSILQFSQADISVAVAIPNGLITPIVKAANQKSLAQISDDMRDLATRAKTGKLQPDEFQGGSFSISNLGMLGIKQFDAIINPPQGAIMALGASESRAVVENGNVVVREIVTATLSCDHRVIDGAVGAKFLASFKQFVENPALILV